MTRQCTGPGMLLWQAQKARTKLHRGAAEGGRIWLVGRWKEVVFGRIPDNLCRRRSSGGVWGIQTIWLGDTTRLGGNNGCGRV